MNKLILLGLEIKNFQCFESYSIEFGRNQTDISGENGSGKTCIYSALTWLLLGKDAYGQTEFDIKRMVNGNKLDKVDVEVTGTFAYYVDGGKEQFVLKRVLREKWTTPRGTQKEVYSGDETLCWWDGTPVQITEYDKRISSIIIEEDFKMLTNLKYFLSLKQETQRSYLCKIAGVRSVEDICNEKQEWREFVSTLSGKKLEDFLKKVREDKKLLKTELERIAPAIDALEKSKPETLDWAALEVEQTDIKAEIDQIDKAIASESAGQDAQISERRRLVQEKSALLDKYNEVERTKGKLLQDAQQKQEKRRWEEDEKWRKLERDIQSKVSERKSLESSAESFRIRIPRLKNEMDELAAKYNEINTRVFESTESAPNCPLLAGHLCDSHPAITKFLEDKEKARQGFNERNQKLIEEVMAEGKAKKAEKDRTEADLQEVSASIARLNEEIEELQSQLVSRPTGSTTLPPIDPSKVEGWRECIQECNKLMQQAGEVQQKIDAVQLQPTPEKFTTKKKELSSQLERVIRSLASKTQIDNVDRQIQESKARAKQLSAKIAALDNQEFTATDINRAVIEDATERINKLFAITKWEMFELQKNGFYKDCCKPTINGVSASLNTAARVNVGIDICNVISRFLGLSVPTFIDYRESVNEIIQTESQIINLYVAPKGTPLQITNTL